MNTSEREFLDALVEAPSPSGYEQPVRRVYHEYTEGFADAVRSDVHGNVIATRNPEGRPRVMFAGHCDELGFQVNYITSEGFIYFNTIGGHDAGVIPGRRVVIHTRRWSCRRGHRSSGHPPHATCRPWQAGQGRGHLD